MTSLMPDRSTLKIKPWIATYTGKKIDMYDPQPDQIEIEDIARGLSQCNRFGGQLRYPVSVAYHSYIVSKHCPVLLKFAGLMHDASEAYLVDIPTPIKQLFPLYYEIEERLMRVIALKFGFDYDDVAKTRKWDWASCCTEAQQLMLLGTSDWGQEIETLPGQLYREITPSHSMAIFLSEFEKLKP